MSTDEGEPRPAWDADRAASLVGKYVLIGMTWVDADGKLVRQDQFHGRITVVDESNGVGIALEGARDGETYWLPPDLRPYRPAPPGEYRLRGTGEVLRDPDLLTTWTTRKDPEGQAPQEPAQG